MLGEDDPGLIESAINNLKQKAYDFSRVYNEFVNNYQYIVNYPDLLEEWNSLKSYADKVRSTIDYITGAVDSATQWVGKLFGIPPSTQLGALPLIPVAAITAAVAAITWSVSEMIKFNQKVNLIKSGAAPGSILDDSPTVIGEASSLLKWAVIGGLVYFLAPKIIERLKGGGK